MGKSKQRGSGWSIRLALFLHRVLGYKFLYYLLYPITFFYFLLAPNVKKVLKVYYANLGMTFSNRVYYEHLRLFAICMVDRFASKINPEAYTFDYAELENPKEILESGCILVYSHFGGWAASSNSGHIENKINIVMQEAMLEGIQDLEKNIKVKSQVNVIDLNEGAISVSVQIANALMNDEVVTVMGDRAANVKSESEMMFLNHKASFNKNPFQIAYKTSKPVLVYFIILTGIQSYKVEYIKIIMDKEKSEALAVSEALEKYVNKLEEVVKMYPNQWFNFYDFWEKK
ncbi:MAG: lipid A biosynthesis acyltransferase [Sulfurovum sp.]|nr:lipid A biosynthesis acyltransferase [Sulfurovum sp.]